MLANGFKGPRSAYARNFVTLRAEHPRVIPILEDGAEPKALAASGVDFELGIRLRRPRDEEGVADKLGGVRGSKHCVLPEATEILIDDDGEGGCDILPGHTTEDVLQNLGYGRTARVGAARTTAPVPIG